MGNDRRVTSPVSGDSEEAPSLEEIPLHSTTLLTLLDERGRIQYESPAIERLYGFDQDELVGAAVSDHFHPDDRETVVDAFERIVSSDEHVVEAVEYRHQQADGTYTWVESVASSNPTSDGYYVINTRDISDRKQHETELERANERLEEFASVVSHDLRNPLSVAQGYLMLAEEDAPSEYHANIGDALERMETLIDGLLTNARKGNVATDTTVLDLAVITETAWKNVDTGTATLVADVDGTVRAVENQLSQLFENLMRNAIEHGGPDVTIRIGELEDGFYIEDDGPGIADTDRENVFDAGFSTEDDGTGFGLSIVKRIVAAHGWEIRITDGSAGGAWFNITGVAFVTA